MLEINAISAAPHMPHDFTPRFTFSRPESLASILTFAGHDLEVAERDGEIFVALSG